jgi:PAS domain-containing protein
MHYPLPLTHSWPLFEQHKRFDLGCLLDASGEEDAGPVPDQAVAAMPGIGTWECDLRDNSLLWSESVFDLFGLPRDAAITRGEIVALYAEPSRASMESLRAYAIKHRRGFTLDAEIMPVQGPRRWMRLIAMPVCIGPRVVRLRGIKRDFALGGSLASH